LGRSCQQLKYSTQSQLSKTGVVDTKIRNGSREKLQKLTTKKVSSGTEKPVPELFRPTDDIYFKTWKETALSVSLLWGRWGQFCATGNRAQLAKKNTTKLTTHNNFLQSRFFFAIINNFIEASWFRRLLVVVAHIINTYLLALSQKWARQEANAGQLKSFPIALASIVKHCRWSPRKSLTTPVTKTKNANALEGEQWAIVKTNFMMVQF